VLAEDSLEGEAEAGGGALGGGIEVVALPLEAPEAEIVENVAGKEVQRLGRDPGPRDPAPPEHAADFDAGILCGDAH
jgi:hypothetical protein